MSGRVSQVGSQATLRLRDSLYVWRALGLVGAKQFLGSSWGAKQFLGDVEKDEHIQRPGNIQGRVEQAGWAGTDV